MSAKHIHFLRKRQLCKGTYASGRPYTHMYGSDRYLVATVDLSESEYSCIGKTIAKYLSCAAS